MLNLMRTRVRLEQKKNIYKEFVCNCDSFQDAIFTEMIYDGNYMRID